MDFELDADRRRLQEAVRAFATGTVRPSAEDRSRKNRWDAALWREIGARRWPGVVVPENYGGMGGGALEHAIIVEEMSRVDGSLGAALNLVQQTIMALLAYGTEDQKQRYLPRLASGETYALTGITEPGAGSSFEDIATTARRDREDWIIDGRKSEVHVAEHVGPGLVFARTGTKLSVFLVDTATPGFRIVETRETIGLRALPMSSVAYEGCRVPAESLLGREGGAIEVFFKSFDLTRIGNAAKCIGIAAGALDDALRYSAKRKVGANVVTDFQGLRWQIADLDTRLEAARLLTYRAAAEYTRTGRSTLHSARAKLLASTTAMEATTTALQITGSHGCFPDAPFQRYMMDAKVSQITGGTIEILRNAIARDRLGKPTAAT